jgi:membrane protein YdbS with pleckstrin-like domain
MRRAIAFVACAVLLLAALIAAVASGVWLVLVIGGCVAAAALVFALGVVDRNYRSWGYAERAEDLLVTRGVLFRRLVVVPYGRMQLVDVTAGPVERRFGIATVRLHTASAGTDASIRGLPPDEAARLRDRLAALGEARSAGL